jgi:hypothetical protein
MKEDATKQSGQEPFSAAPLLGHAAKPGETAKSAAERIATTWKALHPYPPVPMDKWADGAQWVMKEIEMLGLVPVPV